MEMPAPASTNSSFAEYEVIRFRNPSNGTRRQLVMIVKDSFLKYVEWCCEHIQRRCNCALMMRGWLQSRQTTPNTRGLKRAPLSSEKGEEIEKYHGSLVKDAELKILKMPYQRRFLGPSD
jgi:hypothetical protein